MGLDSYSEVGEVMEPCDGDYVIADAGNRGWALSEVGYKFICYVSEFDTALDYVRQRMISLGFFTDCWQMSDHGNIELVEGIFGEGGIWS